MNQPVPFVAGKQTIAIPEQEMTWSPVASPQRLRFNGTSIESTRKALVEAFGSFPIRLSKEKHLQVLSGMIAAAGEGRTPYEELRNALDRYSDLEVK